MIETRLDINSDGLTLKGILCTPETDSWPVVVLCHGFLSHKDSSKYQQLAEVFAVKSIASLRFDFRGCGESAGLLQESTVSGRWNDLQRAIGQVESLDGFNGRLGLLGSSLGGYVVLLEASSNSQVRCTAVWSTPSHLLDLAKRLPEVSPVEFSQECYEDLLTVELLPKLENVRHVLIVHGMEDHQVPPEHGANLFDAVKEPKDLYLLENADHRFSEQEPRDQAIRLTLDWFRKFL